ncbi:MAG TPA: hypothetical protein VJ784_11445 [Pyrinomonadaceae bacterium]|nr:hypothetical protein [Pyrinomonadaceae bacterium]
MHLHPQFQTFLLAEIRKMAGDPRTEPGTKVFFLITHSPYLLDFRIIDDLRQFLILHANEAPTCIGDLDAQDEEVLRTNLPERVGEIDYVVAKVTRISEAAQKAGVFLLPKGALENHLRSYSGSVYQPPEATKAQTFEIERDFILSGPGISAIESRYAELIPILDAASGACEVNLKRHLRYAIGVFIGNIQVAFERKEINSVDTLTQHASIDWSTHNRIFDVVSFET